MQTADVIDILTAARQLSDTETPDGTVDLLTDPELAAYLTKAYRQMVAEVIAFGGVTLVAQYAELTAPDYDLPPGTSILRALSLEVPGMDGRWVPLEQWKWQERNAVGSDTFPAWRWLPNGGAHGELQFFPETAEPATVRLWFVAEFAAVDEDDTGLSTLLGWDDYLAARVAQMILTKEERPSAAVDNELKVARELMRTACADLNPTRAEYVQDTMRVDEDFLDLPNGRRVYP